MNRRIVTLYNTMMGHGSIYILFIGSTGSSNMIDSENMFHQMNMVLFVLSASGMMTIIVGYGIEDVVRLVINFHGMLGNKTDTCVCVHFFICSYILNY